MKAAISILIGFVLSVSVSAEPLIEGWVRLDSGEPVANAQVRIFDMSDLRQGAIARATTDDTGYFALPLAALRASALPTSFALGQNYPNPFNPSTIIPYQLAAAAAVRLEVFNLLGQRIATLVDGARPAGFHTATWHATDAAGRAVGAGVYIYRMTVATESQTGRMVLIDGQAGVAAGGAAAVLPGAAGGGGPTGASEQVYGLVVSGEGLVPYADPAFRVQTGREPVEWVVEALGAVRAKVSVRPAGLLGDVNNDNQVNSSDALLVAVYSAHAALSMPNNGNILLGDVNQDGQINSTDAQLIASKAVQTADAISIPDANLRAVIEAALGKASGAPITVAEMKTLTVLEAGEAGIRDLTGLEFATNLTRLFLEDNQLTDISVLAGLTNLTWLFLEGNQLTDISPLSGLTNLIYLLLGGNQLTDISPLSSLTNLTRLDLEDNQLTDISPLSGLTNLTELFLEGNQLTDVSPLSSLTNLTYLWLEDNQLTDVSPLSGLTNLIYLLLGGNQLTDISPLSSLTNLTGLYLENNPLNASSINDHIPTLQARGVEVFFDDPTPVTDDPTPVTDDPTPETIPDANLRAVIEAKLGKASGATITVAEMTTLTALHTYKAGIRDLTGLEFATNLKTLYLGGNQLTDISALAGLTNLEVLYLDGNTISDLSPLAGLTHLTRLYLGDNQITDISPLAGLTHLTRLYLGDNQITDISPLSGLTNLEVLVLEDNPLNFSSFNDYIPALQARGVTVEFDPADDPTPVTIPDAKLRAAIEDALGKASGATITKGEMTTLTILHAYKAGIRDLTGLEFASNLKTLHLGGNTISDISALAGLTHLTRLYLGGNQITDISALAGLTNLTWLDLDGNFLNASSINDYIPALQARGVEVSSYDPTPVTIPDANLRAAIEAELGKAKSATITKGDMTTLTVLEAGAAGIRDLTGLEFATNLTELSLHFNRITDVSALSGLTNLIGLDLWNNQLTDISPLSGLTNLTWLDLEDNQLTDISPLSGLTHLGSLYLDHNNLTNISGLRGLTNLHWLSLSGNNLKDVSKLASVLADFDNLGWLVLGSNNLKDISELIPSIHNGLTGLWLDGNDIKDISPLRLLTNLSLLSIQHNNITDISVLSGLTNLERVGLGYNNISDISALSGQTNLEELLLGYNNISDISALSDLNLIRRLVLEGNNISDISALSGQTNLEELLLGYNNIRDVSALSVLTNLEWLDLLRNPLSASSINNHIPRLQDRGVEVQFNPNPFRGSDFDIELVFLDPFTDAQKNVFRMVARQWTSVITEDLPDYEFTQGWSGKCGDHSYRIPAGERIDDLRIYVTSFDGGGTVFGWGSPHLLRETHLPVLGCMGFDLKWANLLITGLHEIGHVLGFGTVWDNLGFLQNPNGDTHFNGPRAIAAFNDAGGRNYTGAKVPVDNDLGHWRNSVSGELMVPSGGGALSAITVQSLADLGYGVDVTQVDAFTLPDAAGKASAKIAAAMPPTLGVYGTLAHTYSLPDADPHGLIPEDDLLESTEGVGGRNFRWRSPDMASGLPTHSEPEWSCGTGQHQEPIYVVDPQGRIVRTLHR